jgi:crotonobetainyl-CoA:carnitine CoA-transferase CaiB-like acyl-CoA transferase
VLPGNPIKLSKVAEGPLHIYPKPGQDADRILSGLLGLSPGEIGALRETGALG